LVSPVLLSYARAAPEKAAPLAYISGSLGTLIGADLLNLDRINGLGAPAASIGGAGTDNGFGLVKLGNEPDGDYGHARCLFYRARERHLIARPDGDLLRWGETGT